MFFQVAARYSKRGLADKHELQLDFVQSVTYDEFVFEQGGL